MSDSKQHPHRGDDHFSAFIVEEGEEGEEGEEFDEEAEEDEVDKWLSEHGVSPEDRAKLAELMHSQEGDRGYQQQWAIVRQMVASGMEPDEVGRLVQEGFFRNDRGDDAVDEDLDQMIGLHR